MISVLNDHSPIARMLDLIERRAPGMMRAGGGGLRGDKSANTEVTPELVTRIHTYHADTGPHSYAEMARLVYLSPVLARKIMLKHGIPAVDGRVTRHQKARA